MMRKLYFVILFSTILLSACAEPTPEIPPTFTPKPTSCSELEGSCFKLTFDGESCTYEGQEEMKAGTVTLIYLNYSDENTAVNLVRHTGDETIQDMIDYIGEEPSSVHHPKWSQELGTWRRVAPGKIYIWNGHLIPGIHTMVCARWEPIVVWFGGGFLVDE